MSVLEKLEKLDKLATQGPWNLEGPIRYAINAANGKHVVMVSCMENSRQDKIENISNANLITTVRNALPDLLNLARKVEQVMIILEEADDDDLPAIVVERIYQDLGEGLQKLESKD